MAGALDELNERARLEWARAEKAEAELERLRAEVARLRSALFVVADINSYGTGRRFCQYGDVAAFASAALAAMPEPPAYADMAAGIAQDRAYLLGMQTGWNLGQADADAEYRACVESRELQIRKAKAAMRGEVS